MGSSTGVRHERQAVNPRVGGSTPVRGEFFAEFFSALIQFWHRCQNDLFTEKLEYHALKRIGILPISGEKDKNILM